MTVTDNYDSEEHAENIAEHTEGSFGGAAFAGTEATFLSSFDQLKSKLDRFSTKITGILLVFGLVSAVSMMLAFEASRSDFENNAAKLVINSANSINEIVERNLFERYGDVQAFGLNAAAHNPENFRRPSDSNPLVKAMNGYMTGYGLYKLMLLVGPDGYLLATNTVDGVGN